MRQQSKRNVKEMTMIRLNYVKTKEGKMAVKVAPYLMLDGNAKEAIQYISN